MDNEQYSIRNAEPDEFANIGNLMVSVYSQLEGFPKSIEQPDYYRMLANIGEFTNKPDTELLIAVSPDHQLAGEICCRKIIYRKISAQTGIRKT